MLIESVPGRSVDGSQSPTTAVVYKSMLATNRSAVTGP
jgi:hypothetical protein